MNPYARFGLVSNTVSAAIVVGTLALAGPALFSAVSDAASTPTLMWASLGAAVTVLVVFWLALTETIFPSLFRLNSVRRLVLGKYYIEGTWLQAEKGDGVARMAVIDIQPSGKSFIFSGYALNQDLEIESNSLIEFSRFEWPFMTYKYRNTLSDGADGQREGVGEIQFEMNREAARRYNGYVQHVKNAVRLKIEGTKLRKGSEVRKLRSLEGREEVFGKYWDLFFNRAQRRPQTMAVMSPAVAPSAPLTVAAPAAPSDRRARMEAQRAELGAELSDTRIVPRRRASDWRGDEETTPGNPAQQNTPVAEPVKTALNGTDHRDRPVL